MAKVGIEKSLCDQSFEERRFKSSFVAYINFTMIIPHVDVVVVIVVVAAVGGGGGGGARLTMKSDQTLQQISQGFTAKISNGCGWH
jgi:hypothetical protein